MPNPSVVTNSPVPIMCYEQLLDHAVGGLEGFRWPKLDEGTPCGLCYTSGTTGNPKVNSRAAGCYLQPLSSCAALCC
jgi:acyl-coenzyme A synthetase/AMP-(fatty) acid ligase